MKQEQIVDVFWELRGSILNLLGGGDVASSSLKVKTAIISKKTENGGAEIHGDDLVGFVGGPTQEVLKVKFLRTIPFSEFEKAVVGQVFQAMTVFCKMDLGPRHRGHRKVGIVSSVVDSAVARTARAGRVGSFWNIQKLSQILKKLCWQKYEGASSTSGFLFVGNIVRFKKLKLPTNVRTEYFDNPITVDSSFFSGSLSYRYIDGTRACYIVDQNLKCYGILQYEGAENSWGEILVHKWFTDFLATPQLSGRAFGIFSNRNGEIDLLIKSGNIIRWADNGWKIVDRTILQELFSDYIRGSKEVSALVDVVLGISTARYGALILLPKSLSKWKKFVAGYTDSSEVGGVLRDTYKGRKISTLEKDGLLLKILSSDGSVIVSKNSKLLDAGVLFRLLKDNKKGGSRTAAARSASRFGLAIKISVDGPIQMFRDERLIFQT